MRSATVLKIQLLLGLLCGAVEADAELPERLFEDEAAATISAELALPLSELLRKRTKKETVQGILTIDGSNFSVRVTPRGKSRLKHCSFPPLWLKFNKDETRQTILHKQTRLKMVTHCKTSMKTRGYLAAEYLAYRMLNLLTPYSYRVQPLTINYIDSSSQKTQQHAAFLIEHKKRAAKRTDLELLNTEKVSRATLAPEYTALAALYHYLIGNTDFSFTRGPANDDCCHNTVPMQTVAGNVVNFSYDFDSSGLVNPPYAVPAGNLGLKRLTQRKYRGYCAHNSELEDARAHFLAHKDAILNLIEDVSNVQNLNRKKTLKFINSFFSTLESDSSFKRRIVSACRK